MAVADDQTTAVANFDVMCIVTGEFPAVQAKVECLAVYDEISVYRCIIQQISVSCAIVIIADAFSPSPGLETDIAVCFVFIG